MPKIKNDSGQACPHAFQSALDALDVIGRWEWDATTDRACFDAFVALLYNLDPDKAEEGVPLSTVIENVHADDRERTFSLIKRSVQEGTPYLNEYRVISADGQTRWVLSRGRFSRDHAGRPLGGSGILVDITRLRMSEGSFNEVGAFSGGSALDRAADHAIAAQSAIVELQDAELKGHADKLLLAVGRKLAQQEVQARRSRMN